MATERELPPTNLKIGGVNHFAIGVDDLDQSLTDLEAAGVEVVVGASEVGDGRGDRYAFIHDNERMLVELFEQAS